MRFIPAFVAYASLASLASLTCLAAAQPAQPAQPASPLVQPLDEADAPDPILGRVEGRNYVSPTEAFKISIPVLPELGGTISDTPNVVTFQDDYTIHMSIAAFQQDATQRWELSTRGPKDYFVAFFRDYVFADFKQSLEGATIESANFLPTFMDGALIANILLPGGSMFMDKVPMISVDKPIVAKRGNLLFVKNGFIYVVSVELAERVLERSTYKKTPAEEDEILRRRLTEAVSRITFAKPAVTPTAPAITTPVVPAPAK